MFICYDWAWSEFLFGITYQSDLKRVSIYIAFFSFWIDFPWSR